MELASPLYLRCISAVSPIYLRCISLPACQVERTIVATIEERIRLQGDLDAESARAEMARALDPAERGRGKSERLLDVLLPRAQSSPPA